ncbi:hypothetical protein SAY86_019335 [Trapa natans]|uniref:UFSP1/2/DUB catalytic domain-containing protein n=1 Tax=Trapa natans TaxID=22666 RepID=A0AAN7M075_TRANT|nr:hypothetical protein SAY86_019335 [Trapa natans]
MDFSSCPFCNSWVPSSELERHANGHFEDEEIASDMELARQISLAPPSPPAASEPVNDLQIDMYLSRSVDNDASICNDDAKLFGDGDSISSLASLQTRESFHKIEGGLMALLKKCLELETGDSICILSGYIDHFQCIEFEDAGWGCGWRNIQMLSSHLLHERHEARDVLFGRAGFVPGILSLQRWLELAWERGFDGDGAEQFNHKIYGSSSWIGTTECAALFRSFGLRAKIVDFGPKKLTPLFLSAPGLKLACPNGRENNKRKRNPYQVYGLMDRYLNSNSSNSSDAGSCSGKSTNSFMEFDETNTTNVDLAENFVSTSKGQQVLIDWVWNYFSGGRLVETGKCKVTVSSKPPLYFQHDGHSRTIVGIQVRHLAKGKQHNLLVLDPVHNTKILEASLRGKSGWQKLIKRGVHTLRKPQYQLCYVERGICNEEELEKLKTLDSIYIEL